MQTSNQQQRATIPAPTTTLVVVADHPLDRLAIKRAFPHTAFHFAATFEEAETVARDAHASGFYVF